MAAELNCLLNTIFVRSEQRLFTVFRVSTDLSLWSERRLHSVFVSVSGNGITVKVLPIKTFFLVSFQANYGFGTL